MNKRTRQILNMEVEENEKINEVLDSLGIGIMPNMLQTRKGTDYYKKELGISNSSLINQRTYIPYYGSNVQDIGARASLELRGKK
jgi:hypothetical protein